MYIGQNENNIHILKKKCDFFSSSVLPIHYISIVSGPVSPSLCLLPLYFSTIFSLCFISFQLLLYSVQHFLILYSSDFSFQLLTPPAPPSFLFPTTFRLLFSASAGIRTPTFFVQLRRSIHSANLLKLKHMSLEVY